jgi:hypothetical protein
MTKLTAPELKKVKAFREYTRACGHATELTDVELHDMFGMVHLFQRLKQLGFVSADKGAEWAVELMVRFYKEMFKRTRDPSYVWDALTWSPHLSSRKELEWCDDYLLKVAFSFKELWESERHRNSLDCRDIARALGFEVGESNQNPARSAKKLRDQKALWAELTEKVEDRQKITKLFDEYAESRNESNTTIRNNYYYINNLLQAATFDAIFPK